MSKNLLTKIKNQVAALRSDERGAESSEVILVLVLLVIGLMGAWAVLKKAIEGKAKGTASCINNANAVTSCK